MIKKNKDTYKLIAENIQYALNYNKEHADSPIKLVSIEVSRGVYNIGEEKIMNEVKKLVEGSFSLRLKDNDYYCCIFVTIK